MAVVWRLRYRPQPRLAVANWSVALAFPRSSARTGYGGDGLPRERGAASVGGYPVVDQVHEHRHRDTTSNPQRYWKNGDAKAEKDQAKVENGVGVPSVVVADEENGRRDQPTDDSQNNVKPLHNYRLLPGRAKGWDGSDHYKPIVPAEAAGCQRSSQSAGC